MIGGNDGVGRCATGCIFPGLFPWAYASPFSHKKMLQFDPSLGEKVEQGLVPSKLELICDSLEM